MTPAFKTVAAFFRRAWDSLSLKSWLVFFGLLLFLWLWIFGHHGLYELESLLRAKRNLVLQKERLEREKQDLEAELKRLENPRYMKHLIHQELGFVEQGEVIVKFPEKKGIDGR